MSLDINTMFSASDFLKTLVALLAIINPPAIIPIYLSLTDGIDDETRKKILDSAKRLARRVGYTNVGTMEFLVDEEERPYFIEMNPRIQVEHTETVEQGVLVEGVLHVSFLYVTSDDEIPFDVWQGMIPFSYVMESNET